MRSFISPVLLTLAALTTLSAATFTSTCVAEICGESSFEARAVHSTPTRAVENRALTNAQRLSLGLPLKSPARRRSRGVIARDPQVSATPKYTVTGVIQVKRTSDGVVLGNLDQVTNTNTGMFKYTTTSATALKVQVSLDVGVTSASGVEFTMLNSAGPLLGLVQGRDSSSVDIAAGNYNYLTLNSVASPGTTAGSPPITMTNGYTTLTGLSRAAETSVWNIDLNTGALSLQWTNSDGSAPSTAIFTQSGYIYAGGDQGSFTARYPSPVTALTLTFVQDTVAPV